MHDRDLVVFSGYHPPTVRSLVSNRISASKPWAFWGERPGFHLPLWLGRQYRSLVFPQLADKRAAIWEIGRWAVEAYHRENGADRPYFNVPYCSRLDRYFAIDRSRAVRPPSRIVFSGSLIRRKGVDLLRPLFRRAEQLDIPILLHPAYPTTYEATKGYEMAAGLGLMFDTTIALTRIILAGSWTSIRS